MSDRVVVAWLVGAFLAGLAIAGIARATQFGDYTYKTTTGSFGHSDRCMNYFGSLLCQDGNKTVQVVEFERM